MDKMLTVKQWAEKVGITLNDYSGFLDVYERLVSQQENNFSSRMESRFSNAGNILCTRRAFSYGIILCSMRPPKIDQYEEMLEFIPEFIECSISMLIRYSVSIKDKKIDPRKKAEELLRLVRLKIKAREKINELNGPVEDIKVDEIGEIAEKVKKYGENVEDVELRLLCDIVNDLEELLKKKRIRLSQIPSEKIKLALELNSAVSEKRKILPSQDEYMYIEIPGLSSEEPFIKTFTELDPVGNMRPGVVFDVPGGLKGSLPITPEIKGKIDAHSSERIGENAAQQSLVVIDNSVPKRERMTFMSVLEKVVKKMINSLNRDGR